MTAPPDEGPLLERVRGGEEAAFRALYRRHTPRLYALVRRLMGARLGETEDVVQEAWLRAVKGLSGFRGDTVVIPGKVALAAFVDPDGNALRLAGPEATDKTSK